MSNANDRRIGRKVPEIFRKDAIAGTHIDPGPYIAKIKNNHDPARLGRLEVWIPLISGDEDNPSNWRTVCYASPFFGSTSVDEKNSNNSFTTVAHTYGMWFTVPDIDNFVICTFLGGDPSMGFWFACVPNQIGQQMVPALGSSQNLDTKNIKDSQVKANYTGQQLPGVEFNENSAEVNWQDFLANKRPVHETQAKILLEQGLDTDPIRGAISSSSQRESPSGVFGISTPGRDVEEKTTRPSFLKKLTSRTFDPEKELVIKARKGGHTFVLDDGDFQGKDQLIRLRTAGGHQILMNDTEKIFYIGNSNGSAWVELTGSGHINIYSAESMSIRTEGDFNLHADRDISMHAGGKFNVHAKSSLSVEGENINITSEKKITAYGGTVGIGSAGRLDLSAKSGGSFSSGGSLMFTGKPIGLNSGSGQPVNKPSPLTKQKLDDTNYINGAWKIEKQALSTVVKIAPSHEPWNGPNRALSVFSPQSAAANYRSNTVSTGSGGVLVDSSGRPVIYGGLNIGIEQALATAITKKVPVSYFTRNDNPTPGSTIGNLSIQETKALLTQIAYTESFFDYTVQGGSSNRYLGKYQFGAAALTDMGLIKEEAYDAYGLAAIEYPNSWTGGLTSKQDFLNNPALQEETMLKLAQRNYSVLVNKGAIKPDDSAATVAGMISVSHLLGPGGAIKWRDTGGGADAFGTTGTAYFNRGRYAIEELAKKG